MRVLLSAYSCMPNAGTEPGHGWGWATHLAARGHHVTVLTKEEMRRGIEAYLAEHPQPQLTFVHVPMPRGLRESSPLHYSVWQWRALREARRLHRKEPFDVAHHVTFSSVHVPTQLWHLGIPTIFGPVGGGQTAPSSLLRYLGAAKRSEQARNLLTRALRFSPLHRRWIRKMSAVIAVNDDTVRLVRAMGRKDVGQLGDIGIPESFRAPAPRHFETIAEPLRLFWVGRVIPRKGLPLALDALARTKRSATLTVVGQAENNAAVERMIAERGLGDRVMWSGGRWPWAKVREAYATHDALLFTSIRETCGAQLLEAMALGLPIITLDLHGAHDLVPTAAGIKVPVRGAEAVVHDLAAAIDRYADLPPAQRDQMSRAGWDLSAKHTWDERAAMADELYRRVVGVEPSATPVTQAMADA